MRILLILTVLLFCTTTFAQRKKVGPAPGEKWIALHLLNYTDDDALAELSKQIPAIAKRGVNVLFLEVDYSFDFQSHPELRMPSYITRDAARKFSTLCKLNGIRLVIQFQSLGHQSWAKETYTFLTKYPELDVTPGAFPNNDSIYCREWDPTNPRVNQIIFPVIDEIVDAFQVDGLHLGMDEVFLLSKPEAVNTKDKNPAELFAKVVNEFHEHFTKGKNVQLFIWADRLIDGNVYKYGEWESSLNGTAPAVDMIPKDVVLCDWHYEPMKEYGSVKFFAEKGFKVLPCSWKDEKAAEALIRYAHDLNNPNVVGHMFTTWTKPKPSAANFTPMVNGIKVIRSLK